MDIRPLIALGLLVLPVFAGAPQRPTPTPSAIPLDLFYQAAAVDERKAKGALDQIANQWHNSYTAMFIDLVRLMRRAPTTVENDPLPGFEDEAGETAANRGADNRTLPTAAPMRRESLIRARLLRFLERQTGQRFGEDLNAWRDWMWKLPDAAHPLYGEFKGTVYSQLDRRFGEFFPTGVRSLIRLDEIDWGGVLVNGIPPLYGPKVMSAADAKYLRDRNIVFGIVVHGEARAYPKRILAWHEMAVDRIGGVDLTIVYCTLCGTVIPYESRVGGKSVRFGTSGLLYRSNKLMFDEETKSLWSSLEGKPVVGALIDSGIQLTSHAAVTTTWGEWRTEHPQTTVLSLDTGHKRDYSEGAAYRDYFSKDDLYFTVSHVDRRLKNKDEVLTLRVAYATGETQPIAIAAEFLRKHPVYQFDVGERRFLVITSTRGANRIFALERDTPGFAPNVAGSHVMDETSLRWQITEDALVAESGGGLLPRVPAHRAFWFGWVAQFPQTVLIK